MPRARLLLLALAASCLAGAAAAEIPHGDAAAIDRGRDLVQRNCGMCHAVGAEGDSPNPDSPPFRELSRRYPVDNLAEALAEGILTGHPQMPEFKFSPPEVSDIITYLNSIQVSRPARLERTPASASGAP